MRLYLVHGFIEDAGLLACEYIAAVLGTGTEYFGLPNALHATSAPVWLPHNTIDQLLLELKEHSDEPVYHSLYLEVNKNLNKYLDVVSKVSQDMIHVRTMS